MENKKINLPFYLAIIFFLVFIVLMTKAFKVQRANDFKKYVTSITNLANRDNDRIRILFNLLTQEEKENTNLRSTLAETRNDLVVLSRKLELPAPAPVPAPETATK